MTGIRQGSLSPLHKPQMKRGSKIPLFLTSRLLLTNILFNNNRISCKNDQHCNDTVFIRETKEVSEVRITPGGFRVQSFWPDELGIVYQSGTKPPGRCKKLIKENMKLTEFINNGLKDTLDLRIANQESKMTPYKTTNENSSIRRTHKFRKCKNIFQMQNNNQKKILLKQSIIFIPQISVQDL